MPSYLFRSIAPLAIGFAAACSDPFGGVSSDPAPPASKIDQLVVALTARFTNPDRSGRFEGARRQLITSALTPSKLFADTSVWTATAGATTHSLTARGFLASNAYHFEFAPGPPKPLTLGDSRHYIALTRLRNNEFRWETTVDLAVGSITSGDVASAFKSMLAAPDGYSGADVHAAGRKFFPATSAVLGRGIIIDSLEVKPGPQQTTLVMLGLALRMDVLRLTYPDFASYIVKYSSRSRSHFVLHDAAGRTYFEIAGGQDRWTVRYRLANGVLVSALGPPLPMPDSLQMTADLVLHTKLFAIGFTGLHADFIIDSSAHARGWTVRARQEPDWVLPPLTEMLIGSSLRRPFQGAGSMFQLAVRDTARGSTVLVRQGRLEVQESTMMRVINGFVTRMFNDLNPNVEREEAAFVREVLMAFRRDAQALPSQKSKGATGLLGP